MKDIADRISAVVVESMAAKQSEVQALIDNVRTDIDSLQRSLSTFPRHGAASRREAGTVSQRAPPTAKHAGCGQGGVVADATEQDDDEE